MIRIKLIVDYTLRLRPWKLFGLSLGFKKDVKGTYSRSYYHTGLTLEETWHVGPLEIDVEAEGDDVTARLSAFDYTIAEKTVSLLHGKKTYAFGGGNVRGVTATGTIEVDPDYDRESQV